MLLLGVSDIFLQHLSWIGPVVVAYHLVRFIISYLYRNNLFCLVTYIENFTYIFHLPSCSWFENLQ